MITFLALASLARQDTPQDIPKKDLPKAAVCAICSSNGETHGEEKAAGGVRYGGKSYFFCNASEVAEFKKDPEAYVPPVLPRPAAALKASSLDGKAITLEDYAGKVVLIDFWATWCGPCVKAMPEMDKLFKRHADRGFAVLGVSIDEVPKKAVDFQAKRKFAYPILLDDAKEPSWAAWKVKAIPAIFLVDRKGQVVGQWRGKPDQKAIERAVEKALAE
ncbi:MAG: redoxin family protein [Fimbriimonas sp.]